MPIMKTLTIDGTTFNVVDDGAVRFEEQTLSEAQKTMARENIGAAGVEYYFTDSAESTGFEFEKSSDFKEVTVTNIYTLYENLGVSPHSLGTASDGTVINEYVFSIGGEYNYKKTGEKLKPWADPDIYKPTFLIMSGIHGVEKTAVLATYRFFRDLVHEKNLPSYFARGAVFKVIPIANPWGFTNNSRLNKATEGVNLNRNFDYHWEEVEDTFSHLPNPPGPSACSEPETKIITKWLNDNSDAAMFIDMHGSTLPLEYASVYGDRQDGSVTRAKKIALRGIDKVIPHWKTEFNEDNVIYSYSGCLVSYYKENGHKLVGPATYYASETLGIPSIALECTSLENVVEKNDAGVVMKSFDILKNRNITIGAESLGNILLEYYKQEVISIAPIIAE